MAKADIYNQIYGIIETHKAKSRVEVKEWDLYRSWVNGEYQRGAPTEARLFSITNDEPSPITMETNYSYAFLDTMSANICPTNPQVWVSARREKLQGAAKFREALVNDRFRYLRLFKKIWACSIQTGTCGHAFIKSTWDKGRGSVRYTTLDPRHVWFDRSPDDWRDIRYLIEVTVITEAEYRDRVKKGLYKKSTVIKADFNSYPQWLQDQDGQKSHINKAAQEAFKWVVIYEFYDFRGAGRYYQFLDGHNKPIFEGPLPYEFVRNPYSYLSFNDNGKDLAGVSDIKLIAPLLERLNDLDSLQLEHAHHSIPTLVLNSAVVENAGAIKSALVAADAPGYVIDAHIRHGETPAGMKDVFFTTPTPGLNPDFAIMRDRLVSVIEFILGMPSYARGATGNAELATEVRVADDAYRTRNGKRQRAVEEVVISVAENTSGLYEEFLGKENALPVRLTDKEEVLRVTRETMGARPKNEGPIEYDFSVVPYSPTENHRLVQLHTLQQNMQFLAGNPAVDQTKLTHKLLELMMVGDLAAEGGAPPQAVGQAMQAGALGAPQATGPEPINPTPVQAIANPTGGPGTDGYAAAIPDPLGEL